MRKLAREPSEQEHKERRFGQLDTLYERVHKLRAEISDKQTYLVRAMVLVAQAEASLTPEQHKEYLQLRIERMRNEQSDNANKQVPGNDPEAT